MAKKSSSNAETAPPPKGGEAFKLITGLFFAALSVYTLVALLSYLFTWAEDQSLLSRPDAWSAIVPVENGAGKLGFFWSNLLLSKLFGLGAFIIPFFFAAVAIYSLKIKKVRLLRIFFLTLYGAIILSLLFSFIFGFTRFDDWFGNGVGGSYGYYVNEWLNGMLGPVGAGSVIFVVFMVWLILLNYKVVIWLNNGISSIFKRKPKAIKVVAQDAGDVVEREVSTVIPDPIENEMNQPELIVVDHNLNTSADQLSEPETEPDPETEQETDSDSDEDFLKDIPKETLEVLFDPRLDLPNYKVPPLSLLEDYRDKIYKVPQDELEKNNRKIVKTLNDYKISVERIFARTGPTVTLYEIVPSAGVRISQIKRLEDDIALSLAARGVRIIAPIPDRKSVV